jgi:hypothetical protein
MTASLINFPTKNAGIICKVLTLATPAAVNNGVDGSGINV